MNDEQISDLKEYVDALFVREDAVLRGVRQRTVTQGLPAINLEPHEGKLLQLIVRLCGARRVIEIGTLAGYSAIWIARGLPADGMLVSIEKSETHANVARENLAQARLSDRARVVQGEGLPMLRKLADDAPYDLLFIDADKVNYPAYLAWAAENLRIGGVVAAHNAFWDGAVLNPQTVDDHGMARFNEALAHHPAFDSTIIAIGDGMALGVKTG